MILCLVVSDEGMVLCGEERRGGVLLTSSMQVHNGPPHSSNFGYAHAKRLIDVQNRYLHLCGSHLFESMPSHFMYASIAGHIMNNMDASLRV